MKTLTGYTRYAFLIFFGTHIPISFCIDLQALLPSFLFPQFLQDLFQWYVSTFKDPLVSCGEVWFLSITGCESIFQIPFFFVAVYALLNPTKIDGRGWFRSACLIYGAHVTTTLVPCYAVIITDPGSDFLQKLILSVFYSPYLLFPLWLTVIGVLSEDVFANDSSVNQKLKAR